MRLYVIYFTVNSIQRRSEKWNVGAQSHVIWLPVIIFDFLMNLHFSVITIIINSNERMSSVAQIRLKLLAIFHYSLWELENSHGFYIAAYMERDSHSVHSNAVRLTVEICVLCEIAGNPDQHTTVCQTDNILNVIVSLVFTSRCGLSVIRTHKSIENGSMAKSYPTEAK